MCYPKCVDIHELKDDIILIWQSKPSICSQPAQESRKKNGWMKYVSVYEQGIKWGFFNFLPVNSKEHMQDTL